MEVNLGIHRKCVVCGVHYFCTDGDWVCSDKCSNQLEEEFYKEQLDDLEGHLDNLLCDFVGGYSTEEEFKREWNMALYDAEHIKDLDFEDVSRLAKEKKKEYIGDEQNGSKTSSR